MRFTAAYYLTLIYCTVMLNPLIPLVKDAISHSFAAAYHICVIHAQYGEDHAEKEMADTGAENDNGKHQSQAQSEDMVSVHVATKTSETGLCFNTITTYQPPQKAIDLPAAFLTKHCPPPKFS